MPRAPVKAIEDILGSMLTVTRANNRDIKLIFVVDGMRPASKDDENADMQSKALKRQEELAQLLATEDPEKLGDVQKARKKAAVVHEEELVLTVTFLRGKGVEVAGAPYEADWHLAYYEDIGCTDGKITEDNNLYLLGSKILVSQLMDSKCHIVERAAVMGPGGKLGGGTWDENNLRVFCTILGTDYIGRVEGWGPVTPMA